MRYFVHMGYDGTKYYGWQRQPRIKTVQEVLEHALQEIHKQPVPIMGCGRTDTQVHASQFFFHLDLDQAEPETLKFRLNKRLPDDIAIFDVLPVDITCHARYDAVLRTYDYFIHTYKDPFLGRVSACYDDVVLDVGKMQEAVALLPQYRNFRAFCKTPDKYKHTLCDIKAAQLYTDRRGHRIRLQITSDRFLYRMIRIIVAKLLYVGKGAWQLADFEHHLATGQIPQDLKPAYPQGLFLSKVTYPYLDLPPQTLFAALQADDTSALWQPV